jgi:DNA-binding beta-propeller fold protein YncE
VYVSGIGSDKVNVIDEKKQELVKQITIGKGPHGIRASSDGKYLYADVTTTNEAVVIDANNLEIVKRIPTGNVPFWTCTRK